MAKIYLILALHILHMKIHFGFLFSSLFLNLLWSFSIWFFLIYFAFLFIINTRTNAFVWYLFIKDLAELLLSLANAHLENVCNENLFRNIFYLRKNARHAEQHKISAVLVRPFRAWLAKHSWQKVHDPTRLDRFDLTTHQQKSLSHSTTDTHITHTAATEQQQQRQRTVLSLCCLHSRPGNALASLSANRRSHSHLHSRVCSLFGGGARPSLRLADLLTGTHCSPPPPPRQSNKNHHHHHHYYYFTTTHKQTANVDVDVSAALHSLSLSFSLGWVRNLLELSRSLEETRSVLLFSAFHVSY